MWILSWIFKLIAYANVLLHFVKTEWFVNSKKFFHGSSNFLPVQMSCHTLENRMVFYKCEFFQESSDGLEFTPMKNHSVGQSVARHLHWQEIWRSIKNILLLTNHSVFTKCSKTFAQAIILKTHEIIHTYEKPFSCPKCGKTFAQASNLKTHEKIHTVDKPFSCPKCGKTFAQASNLKTRE